MRVEFWQGNLLKRCHFENREIEENLILDLTEIDCETCELD
jgi:hypothetical protein